MLKTQAAQRNGNLRCDVLAGRTAAAVVLPQGGGPATVAGLPVAIGSLYRLHPDGYLRGYRIIAFVSVSSTTTLAILAGTCWSGGCRTATLQTIPATGHATALVGAVPSGAVFAPGLSPTSLFAG
ncbi:MAG: hypothetical protein IPI44_07700 [Sulfuritalea sp.]|nr:hypothetical protein [Sulfuritalea sp.]